MTAPKRKIYELKGLGWFLCAFIGLGIGITVFTPWRNIWTRALISVDEQATHVRMSWESVRRAGLSGFRVNGVTLGLENSPGVFRFNHADIRVGLNEWNVRLDTGGSECFLVLDKHGGISFEGDLNLTYLLSDDLRGIVRASGELRRSGKDRKAVGWLDVRTQSITLAGRTYEDMAFMGELDGSRLTIRDFSLGAPVKVRAEGWAEIDPDDIMETLFSVRGEQEVSGETARFELDASLGSLFSEH
ncbi:hypothetical protein [Salidesulfovibrio brasiliensis]|uniref:hypothetical protein n=1 Tax=Salidesulfovibrio brasiliensis TaxID=221711 RepID=UPI0006D07910|nr:hypothetical protein [Salidesulfovibrio brasiliensis]